MSNVTTYQVPSTLVPHSECRIPALQTFELPVKSGDANNGDDIVVYEAAVPGKIVSAALKTSGTLGVSCVATLRAGTTPITNATTAGSASDVGSAVNSPVAVAEGDPIQVRISGAAVGADATITVTVQFVRD